MVTAAEDRPFVFELEGRNLSVVEQLLASEEYLSYYIQSGNITNGFDLPSRLVLITVGLSHSLHA
jgi:hypothetical protein